MGRVHGDSLLDINTTNMFRFALLICSVAYATADADASYGYGGYGGYGHLGYAGYGGPVAHAHSTGPTSLMLSSMCPMVTLLPASTVLLTLVLSTLLRGLLTLSTDTEDTDTSDLLPLDSPLCPMPASHFRDMLRDTDTDCGRCQDMGIHYIINSTDNKKK